MSASSELRRRSALLAAVGALALLAACGGSQAAAVGESAEEAAAIEAVAADALSGVFAAHSATVLVWWSRSCPCVRRYDARMAALAERWPDDEVAVLLVASNADESEASVRSELAARGVTLPVVFDEGGALARHYGVRTTPTAAVVGADGVAAYVGWIDNEREPGVRGREPYVEWAVDAVLAGEVGPSSSPIYGCAIARDARGGCCTGH